MSAFALTILGRASDSRFSVTVVAVLVREA